MDIKQEILAYRRYIIFSALSAILLWALYTWRGVLLPFILGLVMAYLLTPVVRWLERILPGKNKHSGTKRVAAIFILLFSFLGVFAFGMFILITTILHQSSQMLANSGQYITDLIARGKVWTAGLRNMFPESMRGYVDGVVQNIGNSIAGTLQKSTSGTGGGSFIPGTLGAILGFAAIPLFLFYLLKDSELAVKGVCSMFGESVSGHVHKILCVLETVLGRYIRSQMILSSTLFCLTLGGLLIIGINPLFALPLAFVYGLGELIPAFGAWIAGAIMVLVVLATQPNKIIAVIIMDLIVKLLENMVLVPKISASTMRIHPAVAIFLLVIGGHFWGLWGMIFTVPLAVTLVEVFKYVRNPGLAVEPAAEPDAVPEISVAEAITEKEMVGTVRN